MTKDEITNRIAALEQRVGSLESVPAPAPRTLPIVVTETQEFHALELRVATLEGATVPGELLLLTTEAPEFQALTRRVEALEEIATTPREEPAATPGQGEGTD